MLEHEKEYLVYKILSGKIKYKLDNKILYVIPPNSEILYEAAEIYREHYDKCLNDDIITDKDIFNILIEQEIWSEQRQEELDKIVPGHIEYWKVELYNAYFRSQTKESVRKYLKAAKDELIRLYNIRHTYDYMTAEGLANFAKKIYIIENTTYYASGKRINWKIFDINQVVRHIQLNAIGGDDIRLLSRTQPWTSIWSSSKRGGRLFKNSPLTSEQMSLVQWATLYENIAKSPDCPPDEIIEDNDMLDGWLLLQRRKREQEYNKRLLESKTSNKDAGEVFIMAETVEDARKIYQLNNPQAAKTVQRRIKEVKEKGIVAEQHLSDVKQDIIMQAVQQQSSVFKNRR